MKTFRIIIGILAIIPVAIIIASIADPTLIRHNSTIEWIYLLIGVPTLVLNLWAWDAPHIINSIYGRR